jgi:mRNA interferase RelE/StbE
VRIIWSEIAQVTFVRFMADQVGMMAVNRAVEALADDPAPLGAFVRGSYRRLRVSPYRVL